MEMYPFPNQNQNNNGDDPSKTKPNNEGGDVEDGEQEQFLLARKI